MSAFERTLKSHLVSYRIVSYFCTKTLPYFPDIGAGLKYEMDGVEHVYIVPVLMHITTSDDFWQTGSCRCYMPLAEGGALSDTAVRPSVCLSQQDRSRL